MTGEDEHLEMAYEDRYAIPDYGVRPDPEEDDWDDQDDEDEEDQDSVDLAFEDARYVLTHDQEPWEGIDT